MPHPGCMAAYASPRRDGVGGDLARVGDGRGNSVEQLLHQGLVIGTEAPGAVTGQGGVAGGAEGPAQQR